MPLYLVKVTGSLSMNNKSEIQTKIFSAPTSDLFLKLPQVIPVSILLCHNMSSFNIQIFCYFKIFQIHYSVFSWLSNIQNTSISLVLWASLVAQTVKNLPAVQRPAFFPWVRKIPWRRAGNPLQYSCHPMDWGAWRAPVHRVETRRPWLRHWHFNLIFLLF